jgi:hypothetical protein
MRGRRLARRRAPGRRAAGGAGWSAVGRPSKPAPGARSSAAGVLVGTVAERDAAAARLSAVPSGSSAASCSAPSMRAGVRYAGGLRPGAPRAVAMCALGDRVQRRRQRRRSCRRRPHRRRMVKEALAGHAAEYVTASPAASTAARPAR